jgi:hypothetical protein
MPSPDRPEPRFAVSVDDVLLGEDLAHATAAGRAAIAPVIHQLKSTGVSKSRLKRCQAEGRDGTHLAGCVKIYIPQPDGPWGAVLTGDKLAAVPTLVLLATGQRHPVQPWDTQRLPGRPQTVARRAATSLTPRADPIGRPLERRLHALIFESVWLDERRVVAVQPSSHSYPALIPSLL